MEINIPVNATALDILRALDLWAHAVQEKGLYMAWKERDVCEKEVRKFWEYITAFRGPDSDNTKLKYETTAVLRWLLVPHMADVCGAISNTTTVNTEALKEDATAIDNAGCGRYREDMPVSFQEYGPEAQVHFLAHYITAVHNILEDKEVILQHRPHLTE